MNPVDAEQGARMAARAKDTLRLDPSVKRGRMLVDGTIELPLPGRR